MNKKETRIYEYLTEKFPEAKIELNFDTPFQLLIAVILSAQCTDVRVNKVTKQLFKKYPTADLLSNANLKDVEKLVYSTGFFKNKSKNIVNLSKKLLKEYEGEVPKTIEELMGLPGVGRKTANVVYSNLFGGDAIAVDTHVLRVANRLGLVDSKNPDVVEKELMKRFDKSIWSSLHAKMVLFGRYYCTARNPKCEQCELKDICLYYKNKRKEN